MNSHVAFVAGLSMFVLVVAAPAGLHSQQADSQQHGQHHPDASGAQAAPQAQAPAPQQTESASMMARMKASGARLDTLVKKMNAANGDAKTEAITELLTALVEDRRHCETMMANMAGMMPMMRGGGGRAPAPAPQR